MSAPKGNKYGLKHGGKGTHLYCAWLHMKSRCYYEKNIRYPHYGARGITVCNEWLHNFSAFRSWSLLNGYRNGLCLHRKDNDQNYLPTNCAWVEKGKHNTIHKKKG